MYKINIDFFKKIDTPEKAYVLGFIAADGSINDKYNLIKIDQKTEYDDILYKIANAMEYNNTVKHYHQKTHFTNNDKVYDAYTSRLTIINKQMVEDIKKYGIIQNKTDQIVINFDLIPDIFLKDFFRGFLEGDGCYTICDVNTRKTPLFQISAAMAKTLYDQIVVILQNHFPNIKIYGYNRHPNHPENITLLITNRDYVKQVLLWMYQDASIYQDKKYQTANRVLSIIAQTEETIRKE